MRSRHGGGDRGKISTNVGHRFRLWVKSFMLGRTTRQIHHHHRPLLFSRRRSLRRCAQQPGHRKPTHPQRTDAQKIPSRLSVTKARSGIGRNRDHHQRQAQSRQPVQLRRPRRNRQERDGATQMTRHLSMRDGGLADRVALCHNLARFYETRFCSLAAVTNQSAPRCPMWRRRRGHPLPRPRAQ